jgi:hypothetical protein
VFSFYVGSRLVVVLNGLNAINEALVTHARLFNDRPHSKLRVKRDIHSTGAGVLCRSM